ncbi:hypothetical protein IT568_00035, partial [bacterium]|nr:hypothetical protein [bacterium]
MKVYFLAPSYPFRGGMVSFVAIFHSKLREKKHSTKILSFTKQFPNWLFPAKSQFETSKQILEVNQKPVFAPFSPLSWFRTFREIRKDEPEIIIFNWWIPFFAFG